MSKATETGKYWDFGWQLVEGCTRVSEGCKNCWSLAKENRFGGPPKGKIIVHPERLDRPLKRKKPATYSIWNDLFHENVPDSFIDEVLSRVALTQRHLYMVLTKRIERAYKYMEGVQSLKLESERDMNIWDAWRAVYGDVVNDKPIWPLQNLCLGVTVEGPEYLWRIAELLKIPGFHFVSIEPCLGDVDMTRVPTGSWAHGKVDVMSGYLCGEEPDEMIDPITWKNRPTNEWERGEYGLDWVIVGPETGPKRRQCNPKWIRSIIEQCDAAGVPVFVKAFPMPDGRVSKDMNEWPEWARRRELPNSALLSPAPTAS